MFKVGDIAIFDNKAYAECTGNILVCYNPYRVIRISESGSICIYTLKSLKNNQILFTSGNFIKRATSDSSVFINLEYYV